MPSELKDIFLGFCKFGDPKNKGTMTGAKFFKFAKDCKLVDKQLTRTSIDLFFSRIKPKGQRTINFKVFKSSLRALANLKFGSSDQASYDRLLGMIKANGQASSSGTRAQKNRFHDDKSLYTGVYARGGPSVKSGGKITLSKMMDRSGADVRGINHHYSFNK
mmetsp:Transcript_31624/g.55600  ORF Transcript_31624/g.55600 Transcript_31624/m.55600 type:complete len:162 (-) Transcript_31624:403-888(-)|eukprot:CAMPEP_0197523884 /NCGR_PEP_ID=MMETSP1318-20131121/8718_1 /TAXON_ID=552666 /ORGANISM="Partenskyella glossopodia, Strain RCC365" /LENGTH=161 /DNA_ID=CAMNT_0043076709 /DNA_START=77 /DNA_END=562 /DNA_ORIENTATION=-